MLLFDAGIPLRAGALNSDPKACREQSSVKEKATSPSTVRLNFDLGNFSRWRLHVLYLVSDLEWNETGHGDVGGLGSERTDAGSCCW